MAVRGKDWMLVREGGGGQAVMPVNFQFVWIRDGPLKELWKKKTERRLLGALGAWADGIASERMASRQAALLRRKWIRPPVLLARSDAPAAAVGIDGPRTTSSNGSIHTSPIEF